ncbi:MAG: helix-turn-helix domain-containing protein [Magnetococcales bacterium]|nr:helix-turn-helix domain-containing protein [Magnetococcales bacterium]
MVKPFHLYSLRLGTAVASHGATLHWCLLFTLRKSNQWKIFKMGTKKSPPILSRIEQYLQIYENKKVSDLLGVAPSTVSNWRDRSDVPYSQAVEFANHQSLSLDWLLAGRGPMRRNVEDPPPSLTPDESTLLEAYRSTDEPGRAALLATAKALMRK